MGTQPGGFRSVAISYPICRRTSSRICSYNASCCPWVLDFHRSIGLQGAGQYRVSMQFPHWSNQCTVNGPRKRFRHGILGSLFKRPVDAPGKPAPPLVAPRKAALPFGSSELVAPGLLPTSTKRCSTAVVSVNVLHYRVRPHLKSSVLPLARAHIAEGRDCP